MLRPNHYDFLRLPIDGDHAGENARASLAFPTIRDMPARNTQTGGPTRQAIVNANAATIPAVNRLDCVLRYLRAARV